MQRFAGVFFEVGTLQAHGFVHGLFANFQEERDLAAVGAIDLAMLSVATAELRTLV